MNKTPEHDPDNAVVVALGNAIYAVLTMHHVQTPPDFSSYQWARKILEDARREE